LTLCWRGHNQAGKKLKILVWQSNQILKWHWRPEFFARDSNYKWINFSLNSHQRQTASRSPTLKNDIVLILKLEKFEKRPKIANDDDNTWRPCLFFWQLKCKPRNSKITINGRTANLNSNFQGQLLSKTNMYLYLISVFTLFCPLSWTRSNLRYQFIMRCK
jgi:hypothetical protein